MYNTDDVIAKVRAHRAATKASLTGIERMQYNLRWKLRNWILRETDRRCVCVGEVVDKVRKYAPKAILRSREQFERAVEDIWSIAHDYGIDNDDMLREDLEYHMDDIFGETPEDASPKTNNTMNPENARKMPCGEKGRTHSEPQKTVGCEAGNDACIQYQSGNDRMRNFRPLHILFPASGQDG